MPRHDGKGPEGDGSLTGRKLGKCSKASDEEKLQKPGKGMGRKQNSSRGKGKGKGTGKGNG